MIEFDDLVMTGPMFWWMEGVLYPTCDMLDSSVLSLTVCTLSLPLSFAAMLLQFAWWGLIMAFAIVASPFILGYKLWKWLSKK